MDRTFSERWAGYVGRKPLGPVFPIFQFTFGLIFFGLGSYSAYESPTRGNPMFVMSTVFLFTGAIWWERYGFRQLLDRKDREIEDLRRDLGRLAAALTPK